MSEEQQIKKGFNAGYLMAKHKPELSQTMQDGFIDKENPFALGFIAGAKEHGHEVSKPRTKNYTVQIPKSHKKDKSRDKDFRDM